MQDEFFALGDREKQMIAANLLAKHTPLCDRTSDGSLAYRQVQFYDYFALDFFESVADLLDPPTRSANPAMSTLYLRLSQNLE